MLSSWVYSHVSRWIAAVAVAFATVRFGVIAYNGARNVVYGDYAATLPGGYVERLNPTLWNAPDLTQSWAYHEHTYLHGPTQFLALYPMAYLNSYAAIARVLLVVFAFVLLAGIVVLWRTLASVCGREVSKAAVFAATLSFFPLLQAYAQHEFECVMFLAVTVMYWTAVQDRRRWLGATVAFVTWFKYLPIVLVPYLVARRWWKAVAAFAITSAAILTAGQLLFGLRHFVDNDVPAVAGGLLTAIRGGVDFCQDILPRYRFGNTTFVSMRWAACTLEDQGVAIRPLLAYLMCAAVVAYVGVVGFVHVEWRRDELSASAERWRRILELSVIVTVYSTFFFAHYYYLSVLAAPLAVLLVRYLEQRRYASLVLWGATYFFLSAFTLPVTWFFHPRHGDAWTWYMRHVVYLPGELGLLALLLREYVSVE